MFKIPQYERELAANEITVWEEFKAPKDTNAVAMHQWLGEMINTHGPEITVVADDYDGVLVEKVTVRPLTIEERHEREAYILEHKEAYEKKKAEPLRFAARPFVVSVDNMSNGVL